MSVAKTASRERALLDDRRGLRAAQGRLPGHLDLEDPLPRGPGAHAPRRTRGGYRLFGEDDVERLRTSSPPARRVPPAPGDPRRSSSTPSAKDRKRKRAAALSRPRGRLRPGRAVRADRHLRRLARELEEFGLLAPRTEARREALLRDRRGNRDRVRSARRLRDQRQAPQSLQDRRRPRGQPARGGRRAGASRTERRAPAGRLARARGARRGGAGAGPTPVPPGSARVRRALMAAIDLKSRRPRGTRLAGAGRRVQGHLAAPARS